jgi:D-cysteine desulfhydrase
MVITADGPCRPLSSPAMPELPPRLPLAILPTPLEPAGRLSEAWGGPRIWVKRDDLTGFGLSGNKVRKLEFHFAAAHNAGADTVITCGAIQSNHARATALAAARVGLRSILLLRHKPGLTPRLEGNLLLDALAGARIRFITPEQWPHRDALMAEEAERRLASGHRSWVIPEGASDSIGMWGFVLAMRELADQMTRIEGRPAVLWHAASSGGTTAGIAWGADRLNLANPIVACSIGDPAHEIETKVQSIWREAASSLGAPVPTISVEYDDKHIGGGYGVVKNDDLAVQAEATALTGLVLDPTYTGKALTGLRREIAAGRFTRDDNIVFWHTGGGFAVFAHDFSRTVSVGDPVEPPA